MIIQHKVNYIAVDRQKQEIPWIEVRDADGEPAGGVHSASTTRGARSSSPRIPKDEMDCMDCHNRPTHIYLPPEAAVDRAMTTGLISRTLPWVKKVVVDALVARIPHDRRRPTRG